MTQPPILNYQSTSLSREVLREVAARQRAIIFCVLITLFVYAFFFVFKSIIPPSIVPVVALLLLMGVVAVEIVASVFIFLLATKVYGTGFGILLGILALIPFFGLIALLMVSSKATQILKSNGIKVGLLGAKVD